ncbi:oligogalacturonate-specific porin KdgM family protein [Symbiopectobacterium purcellii]|uniref:Oligogalacturonate-specific porin KdgM family protein n=1 Tax=Symbiopectobacterium purcellii TaxID=2871826 RepID=A0ABX9AJI2_9ENTR|nr:oligogalacturonate-specific porin KdgM family protein [Symbiopectobacterium purcellii]QZN95317.1 oligogalacturonate-specific porin KdgM family protein [Symbiopectobacterium purcellii]
MKLKLVTLAITSLVALNTFAATIDYRHEFKNTSNGDHKDRLLFSHRFEQGFGLSVEARWGQHANDKTPNKPFNESVSNGTEVIASYLYNFNKTFSLEPGFSLDSTSSVNNYRPYLRGKANLTNDLSVSLRYRPYYKRTSGNIGTSGRTSENGYNLTSVIAYNFLKNYTVEYELDYQKANAAGIKLADNDSYSFGHDVKLSYKWDKNWRPFVAVGNVPESGTTDNRQTRYRVGVQYSF